jgi:hypothetical protein
MGQDVRMMKRRKRLDLLDFQVAERIKLAWEVRRQVQQEILQRKLAKCYLKPRKGRRCTERYPEAMQPMIEDFMRKADQKTKLYRV